MHELLGTMGLFGCLWSALQGLPLELATLRGATWSAAALVPFLGFGLAMFAFYRWGACMGWGGLQGPVHGLLVIGSCSTAHVMRTGVGAVVTNLAPAWLPSAPALLQPGAI